MLDAPFPLAAEEIEAQAVLCGVEHGEKCGAKGYPLRCIHQALKDRVLHPLPLIFAQSCHTPQTLPAAIIACTDVVAYENKH